jgi:hypothetical protein
LDDELPEAICRFCTSVRLRRSWTIRSSPRLAADDAYEALHGVRLPFGCSHDLGQRRAFGAFHQGDDFGFLVGAIRFGLAGRLLATGTSWRLRRVRWVSLMGSTNRSERGSPDEVVVASCTAKIQANHL